jgi:excisionase family DNA binding protein
MMTSAQDLDAARLLDCSQVADILGCSLRTVRRITELRTIPFVKVGRLVRFRPQDIERYIALHTTEAVR